MGFKNGGVKTKYVEDYDNIIYNEYTIYCAYESVSDVCVYKMFNSEGEQRDICISAESDSGDYGNRSKIDCLYHLKLRENKEYKFHEHDIVIEEMTREEMKEIFVR